ncbi:MAG: aminotransferase class I/II-fold pyridoxal phosphate-dependent enzyme [Victivallales bacterium]|nr:aminotransferase class I/II-fold pyridoxal phosphate-dependent enzyme [Victivallales bacterium]
MNSLFEQCFNSLPGTRITEKTERLAQKLASAPPLYYAGLHMTLLEGVKPLTRVRTPSGQVRDMLMLGSNSFLNLNFHPQVLEAERKAAERFGSGAGSPPLYAGQTVLHEELEERLASFCGTEAALVFPAGYSGNIGVLSALCRPCDTLFCDSSNHASLFDGARLSGTRISPYLHLNTKHLEKQLKQCSTPGKLIVSDGVFSMEGSIAPIDELVRLKWQYDAFLMIDDAHGFWAVGDFGHGSASLYGLRDEVDLHYGTFSKALGGVGGFAAGQRNVIDYLRYYARSTFFSSALPATVVAATLESIRIVEEEPWHLENLRRNRDYFQSRLEKAGFNTLNSRSAIIPLLVGDEDKLGRFQMALFDAGIFTNIGATPAVNASKCRLRLNVMASHTLEQLKFAADTIEQSGRNFGVIE